MIPLTHNKDSSYLSFFEKIPSQLYYTQTDGHTRTHTHTHIDDGTDGLLYRPALRGRTYTHTHTHRQTHMQVHTHTQNMARKIDVPARLRGRIHTDGRTHTHIENTGTALFCPNTCHAGGPGRQFSAPYSLCACVYLRVCLSVCVYVLPRKADRYKQSVERLCV